MKICTHTSIFNRSSDQSAETTTKNQNEKNRKDALAYSKCLVDFTGFANKRKSFFGTSSIYGAIGGKIYATPVTVSAEKAFFV